MSTFSVLALAAGSHHSDHDHNGHSTAGQPGDAAKVNQTVEINMNDKMRFTPSEITIKVGDTVRFL